MHLRVGGNWFECENVLVFFCRIMKSQGGNEEREVGNRNKDVGPMF